MKILHPTDFSGAAGQARAEAVRLVRAAGGEVVLLYVVEEPIAYGEGLAGEQIQQIYDAQRRWAEERLDAEVADTRAAGVAARGLLRFGVTHQEILLAAEDERPDLIVMGTHGRGGLGRLLLGSVADRVIRSATCPVMTVRETRKAAAPAPRRDVPAAPRGGTPEEPGA